MRDLTLNPAMSVLQRVFTSIVHSLRVPVTGLALAFTIVAWSATGLGLEGRQAGLMGALVLVLWAAYLPLEFALVVLVAGGVGCAWSFAWIDWIGATHTGAEFAGLIGVAVASCVAAVRLEVYRGAPRIVPRALLFTLGVSVALLALLVPAAWPTILAATVAAITLASLGADILLFKGGRRGTPNLLHLLGGHLIFGYLGGAQFVLFGLIAPVAFLFTREPMRLVRRLCSRGMRFMFDVFPYGRIEWHGVSEADLRKPAVLVSNHQSSVDIPLILSLPADIRILVSPRVWKTPVLGIGARILSHVLVDRERPEVTLARCRERLAAGASVHSFPEGTRSEGAYPGRFRRGAFEIAWELQADVLPIVLVNSRSCVPRDAFWVGSFWMSIAALPRVTPETFDYTLGSAALMKHVQSLVRDAVVRGHRRLHSDPKFLEKHVFELYRYQARRVRRAVRRELRAWHAIEGWRSLLTDLDRILVLDNGCGVGAHLACTPELRTRCTAWLQIAALEAVASRSAAGNDRLHFSASVLEPAELAGVSAVLVAPGLDIAGMRELLAELRAGCLVLVCEPSAATHAALQRLGLRVLKDTPGAYERVAAESLGARA